MDPFLEECGKYVSKVIHVIEIKYKLNVKIICKFIWKINYKYFILFLLFLFPS